jgi:hypothetical protein
MMRRQIQLAAAILLIAGTTAATRAQIHFKHDKPAVEDLSWLWQYTKPTPDGNENGLTGDPHFQPFLQQHLTAPQSFWGNGSESLADAAVEFLAVPGIARADDNRYITITGCVPHFCPARGMLFVDTVGSHPLVVFAAIDWTRESHTTDEANAEYTLWIFPDRPLTSLNATDEANSTPHLPPPLQKSLGVFSAALNRGSVPPLVTRAFVVNPDGKPHEIAASQTGVTRYQDSQPLAPAA